MPCEQTGKLCSYGAGAPLYAGYTAYRGVVSFRVAHVMPGEYWGAGLRFGLLPLSGGRYYWFATRNAPAQTRQSPEATQKLLSSLFRHWASPIPALIAATEPQAILQNDIADRPPLLRVLSATGSKNTVCKS